MSPGSIANARAIIGLLQQLQGDYSTGHLLVRSTGATGSVPAHSYAIPIVDGSLVPEAIVRVEENPATTDHAWPVTSSGVLVDVTSLQGGAHVNQVAGVECRWDEPLDGIEATSEVATGGLTGGAAYANPGTLKCLREHRSIGSRVAAQDLLAARVGDFPAAVLAWVASYPVDGSVSATSGPNSARLGAGKRIFKHEWELALIASRLESSDERSNELDRVRNDVMEVLTDTTAYRRAVISSPQGIEILDGRSALVTATSYIDVVRFTTSYCLRRRDSQAFADWLKTRVRMQTAAQGTPATKIDIPDVTVAMPPAT